MWSDRWAAAELGMIMGTASRLTPRTPCSKSLAVSSSYTAAGPSPTPHTTARYGVATTVVGGIVLGGIIGVGAGIAINVIRKVVDA